ncbi:MAG: hypothetical protein ACUVTR_01940 [Dehalococcoidia bacterium]
MGLLVEDRIIIPGRIVNLAAAGAAAAVVVFAIPALVGQLVGTKSVKIHRVNLHNNAAGNTQVLIGTGVGAGFVALLPALDSMNGLNDSYGPETALIQAEAFANITAYPVALLAGGSIDCQLEVIIVG